jgi:penicillin-binding protein 2
MDVEFLSGSGGFKNKKIKFTHLNDIEPHEALLDGLAQRKEEEMGLSGKKFEVPLTKRSLSLFYLGFLFLLIFLFARTFQLQIVMGEDYLAQAQENKFAVLQIQAERGVIYDKNMNQLVFNKPTFDLVLDKSNLPEDETQKAKIFKEVSQIINEEEESLKNKIKSGDSIILGSIPRETLIILETKIKELPGFKISQNLVRDYKDSNFFSHIIGYMGRITASEIEDCPDYLLSDWTGQAGLEKTYESILKKNSGKMQIERDVLGQEISRQVIEEASSGNSLVLWLDSDLQKKITEILKEISENIGGKNAAAVALDPKTGGVLSLVSTPTFDNNLFNKGSDQTALGALIKGTLPNQSLYNLAIAGQFPSGSTIKPLLASAALQENIITADKKINCRGQIEIPNPWYPDTPTIKRDWAVHGLTDMRKAIAESCDVYFYTIGGGFGNQQGLGVASIDKYLKLYGWGEKTGIDLSGESIGLVPSPAQKIISRGTAWTDGDTYNITIGQGDILVTPLQMAASFVPIANGGKLLQPQVVQKIIDSSKNVIENKTVTIIRENFISTQNLQVVREGMRNAVTGESAPQASSITLNSLPVSAAAKTGTAELGKKINGVMVYDNWITVFAPYDDPQIVLTIVFQDVVGEQGATKPAAKDILQWYFTEGAGASGI